VGGQSLCEAGCRYGMAAIPRSCTGDSLAACLAGRPVAPCRMPLATPAFWKGVWLSRLWGDSSVLFDLYNEPYPDGGRDTSPPGGAGGRGGWRCPGVTYTIAVTARFWGHRGGHSKALPACNRWGGGLCAYRCA